MRPSCRSPQCAVVTVHGSLKPRHVSAKPGGLKSIEAILPSSVIIANDHCGRGVDGRARSLVRGHFGHCGRWQSTYCLAIKPAIAVTAAVMVVIKPGNVFHQRL